MHPFFMLYENAEEIFQRYKAGKNIISHIEANQLTNDRSEMIRFAYDLQAGTYAARWEEDQHTLKLYYDEMASILGRYVRPGSTVLEAGIGEATTFFEIGKRLLKATRCFGFDISLSRLKTAQAFLEHRGAPAQALDLELFIADMNYLPLLDDSIDVVYSVHSLEPNGGNEKAILGEALRVARTTLVLFEPIYELASNVAQARMEHHGYVRNLKGTIEELGYAVKEHRLLAHNAFDMNPTGVIVVEKRSPGASHEAGDASPSPFACPLTKTRLVPREDFLFSPQSLLAYPRISRIPLLDPRFAMVASYFSDQG